LVPAPAYFLSLPRRFSRISTVEILPRRGEHDNEMTRFRYDAILSIETQLELTLEVPFLEPPAQGWRLGDLRSALNAERSAAVGFARVRNARIERDMRLAERLGSADSGQTLSFLCKDLDQTGGLHPEEIVRLAAETGHKVTISWASGYLDGSFDAGFVRQNSNRIFPSLKWPHPAPESCVYFSNAPRQMEGREKLINELVKHCQARLPVELAPRRVHLVDSIPRGDDGDIHFPALLSATEMAGF
jgi:hypothetical protein